LENKKAIKLIDSIVKTLESNQIVTDEVVEMVKELRPFAVEEKLPVVAKTLRLVYEHIEENEVFAIPIPQDEPLIDEETGEELEIEDSEIITGSERLLYLVNLIKKSENPANKAEIREYNRKMEAFAD
jgi:CO dehydrogenase/acetyl-CoA synthase beta subunit